MKFKMHLYFLLTLFGTLLIPDACQSDHIGSDVSDDMLAELSNELTPFECWVTSSYLAQRSSKPKAGQEIAKIGGHTKKFNCYEALTYWKEDVLPLSQGANEIKVDGYGLRSLAKAIAFAGRKDLKDWIFTTFLNTKRYPNSGRWNYHHREVYMEAPEKVDDLNTRNLLGTAELLSTSTDESQFVPTQTQKSKKEYDSPTQQYATVVTYVVAFILASVIICFAITTLMVCIRPQRFRQRHLDEVAADEYEYLDDGSGYSNGRVLKSDEMDVYVKASIVKESSEPTGKVLTSKLQIDETESVASGENDTDQNDNVRKTQDDKNNNEN